MVDSFENVEEIIPEKASKGIKKNVKQRLLTMNKKTKPTRKIVH